MSVELFFWAILILLIYPYGIYPFALMVLQWARGQRKRLPEPARPPGREPRISVIVPVYNESAVLNGKIRNCLALEYPGELLEILVVCDGCTDGSDAIARGYEQEGVRTIVTDTQRGKIFAMNLAARQACGDLLVFTDARAVVSRHALRAITERFADRRVGAVSGAIRRETPADGRLQIALGTYRRVENRIRSMESALSSSIGTTGALYAVRASLYPGLPSDTILDDLVLPFQLMARGYRVLFDPAISCRMLPSPVGEFSRKRRTLAGNYQALWRYRHLLNPLRSLWCWQILSHKASRLLAPFCLTALLVTSALADGPFFRAVLIAQIAFYSLALLGQWAGQGLRRVPGLQVPYGICLLQAANLCGLVLFSFGRLDVRWKKE